ncbi:MAG TPA: O-antigen ligase family protein [Terriglobales bacterium]|jgi:putative inorganic carbon (HCO3(-)) transporter|nr:O-antigen ligase family protein [Terriglobales bacterium]
MQNRGMSKSLLMGAGTVTGIAVLLGLLVAGNAWLPLAAVAGLALLVLWPAHMWLGVFVSLVPFDNASLVQAGTNSLTATSIAGLIAMLTLVGWSIALGRFRLPSRLSMLWLIFIAWQACSVLWAVDQNIATERLPTMASLFLFYMVVTCCEFSEREITRIARFTIFGGCVAAAICLYLFHNGVFWRNTTMRGTVAFGSQQIESNVFAAGLLLPLSLVIGEFLTAKRWGSKLLLISCAFVIALGIFYTTSRGALLAVMVMILFYVCKTGISWRVLAAPILLGLALLLAPGFLFTRLLEAGMTGGAGRLYIWQTGLAAFKDYFAVGAGVDNFSVIYNEYAGKATHFAGLNREPHNTFLEVAVESGVIGLLLFILVIASHLRQAWQREALVSGAERVRLVACESAAWGMLVASFFLHLLWFKEYWVIWMMLAICSRAPRKEVPQFAPVRRMTRVASPEVVQVGA